MSCLWIQSLWVLVTKSTCKFWRDITISVLAWRRGSKKPLFRLWDRIRVLSNRGRGGDAPSELLWVDRVFAGWGRRVYQVKAQLEKRLRGWEESEWKEKWEAEFGHNTACEVNTEGTLEINACLFICSKHFLSSHYTGHNQGSPSPALAELSA